MTAHADGVAVEGKQSSVLLVRVQTVTASMEIILTVPEEAGNRSTYTTLRHIPEGLCI